LLAPFVKKYEPGETILEEGTRGDEMFYILAGAAAVLRGGATVRTLASGDYFGEMSMLLDEPRTASVKALDPGTKVVVISRGNFDAILAENPVIVRKLLTEMARRLKETTLWGTRRDSD
ncbi:MAG: cyclic nucleotide-binding domain-containing protein, partial [Kiritimatiellia bacterium]